MQAGPVHWSAWDPLAHGQRPNRGLWYGPREACMLRTQAVAISSGGDLGVPVSRELLKGSIALLILKLLSERDRYGYEIIQEAARRTENAFEFKEGTLYPALHQLEKRGYLRSEWRLANNGKQRKYYGLTAAGRKAASQSQKDWAIFTRTVNAVLANG